MRSILTLSLMALAAAGSAAFGAEAAPADASKTPLSEWYYADALWMPPETTPETAVHGSMGFSLEWMVVFNLSDKDAEVTVTHYFENDPPVSFPLKVPAHRSVSFGGHGELPENLVPRRKLFGVRVQSPVPVAVQATRAESETGTKSPPEMPGRSFLSRMGHPGPLGVKETAWVYCDSIIQRENPRCEELEWLTVLNPNPDKEAKVKVTFNYGKQQSVHEYTVPAERVSTIALKDLDVVKEDQHAGVLVESDIPIVVDQVRRYWFRWHPAPAGTWVVTPQAVGGMGFELPAAK